MKEPYLLFENAQIRTLDEELPEARSMLVFHGTILSLFKEAKPNISAWGNIQRIDCQNLVMLPAFTDAHVHLMDTGEKLGTIDVSRASCETEAVSILKKEAGDVPPGEWIQGSRWGHNLWKPPSLPKKESLDAAFPSNPVYLFSKCGHLVWLNSLALREAGVKRDTPNPPDGEIERDPETGEATGILKEEAEILIHRAVPDIPDDRRKELIRKAVAHFNRHGFVNVHASDSARTFSLLQAMQNDPNLSLNVAIYLPNSSLESVIAAHLKSGLGDQRLRFGGIKLFVDGSLGGRTAWMYEPYNEEPHNTGIPVTTREEIKERITLANQAGICTMIHAIGDRAVDMLLDVHTEINPKIDPSRKSALPNRIEHFQLLTEEMLPRIRNLKVVASMQPVHIFSDWYAGNRFWGKRSRYAYALRTLLDAGCPLVLGSDSPVEPINPFWAMYATVERKDLEGKPNGGWYPEERLTPLEALQAFCSVPPTIVGEGTLKGSLRPGMRADFILANYDPITDNPEEWKDAEIFATASQGDFVYKNF